MLPIKKGHQAIRPSGSSKKGLLCKIPRGLTPFYSLRMLSLITSTLGLMAVATTAHSGPLHSPLVAAV